MSVKLTPGLIKMAQVTFESLDKYTVKEGNNFNKGFNLSWINGFKVDKYFILFKTA